MIECGWTRFIQNNLQRLHDTYAQCAQMMVHVTTRQELEEREEKLREHFKQMSQLLELVQHDLGDVQLSIDHVKAKPNAFQIDEGELAYRREFHRMSTKTLRVAPRLDAYAWVGWDCSALVWECLL